MTEPRWDLIHDAVIIDDEPETPAAVCDGRCLTASDIGLPEYGDTLYAADPECSLHGDTPERRRDWLDEQDALGSDCA